MTKHIIFFILLSISTLVFADPVPIPKYEDKTVSDLNEQIRSLNIDEQIKQSGQLSANSFKVTDMAEPSATTDGATKNYVDTAVASYQPLDADLTAIGALAKTDGNIIVGDGSTWVAESGATARTSLGLAIGTNVQAYDLQLDDLADGTLSGAGTVDTSSLTGTTYLPDNTVDTTALKTATSEVSATSSNDTLTLTGGTYCFYPQIKMSVTTAGNWQAGIKLYLGDAAGWTTYATNISLYNDRSATSYAQARYVTASGEDYWLWLKIDKNTKDILAMSGAQDHCAYGNSNDFTKEPHPFRNFNPDAQDIILIEKMQAKAIQQESKDKGISVLELVDSEYKIDFSKTYEYTPIYSGQFSPDKKPVLVESIPDYITVRKLTYMSNEDKLAKEGRQKEKQVEFKAKELDKKNKLEALKSKMGITDEELELIRGIR